MAKRTKVITPLAPGTKIRLTTWDCWASYETTIVRFSRIDAGRCLQYIVLDRKGNEVEYPAYKFRVLDAA